MQNRFTFRYQNTKGQLVAPMLPAAELAAFEKRHNDRADYFLGYYSASATYVLGLLTDDGATLLRGYIIAA